MGYSWILSRRDGYGDFNLILRFLYDDSIVMLLQKGSELIGRKSCVPCIAS